MSLERARVFPKGIFPGLSDLYNLGEITLSAALPTFVNTWFPFE